MKFNNKVGRISQPPIFPDEQVEKYFEPSINNKNEIINHTNQEDTYQNNTSITTTTTYTAPIKNLNNEESLALVHEQTKQTVIVKDNIE